MTASAADDATTRRPRAEPSRATRGDRPRWRADPRPVLAPRRPASRGRRRGARPRRAVWSPACEGGQSGVVARPSAALPAEAEVGERRTRRRRAGRASRAGPRPRPRAAPAGCRARSRSLDGRRVLVSGSRRVVGVERRAGPRPRARGPSRSSEHVRGRLRHPRRRLAELPTRPSARGRTQGGGQRAARRRAARGRLRAPRPARRAVAVARSRAQRLEQPRQRRVRAADLLVEVEEPAPVGRRRPPSPAAPSPG